MLSAIDPRAAARAGPRPHAHPRAGDPGRRGHRAPRRRRPRAERRPALRRRALRPAAARAAPRRPDRRRHPRSHRRPPREAHPRPVRRRALRARRGRRDAADGLPRRGRGHLRAAARRPSGGAVLGDHARRDPRGLAPAPELAGRGVDQVEDADGHQHPSALRRAARAAEGGRARAHPAGRGLRRRAGLRAHPPEHHRRHRRPQPARVLGGGDLRRPVAAAAREDHQRSALR